MPPASAIPDPELAELMAFFQETLGFVPNSVRTMAYRPAIARAFVALNRAVMVNHGRVTSEQKRLVALLASNAAGCRYCQAHAALAAQRYGASTDRLRALWEFRDSPLFTPAEKAAFEFAVAAASIPNAVDAAIAAELRAHWDEGEIVELLGVISLFGFLNRWNDSMATTLEPDAQALANDVLGSHGWTPGKHG
ncbi:carboxymuconolactone decarboxylase family protein [Thermomonas sp. S9]|uniref:carboxymuconolactone decarboxylase family protein n=1 Tax=Thermomonas sp. S9 TaxID=2885203 RepID=UPI00216AFB54|nr:carboxymuconolactone decarboxylase family protein [Thermomonas sp. S9]MCR6496520.1 carboxymuconolactone decarboxylase family protein [Thermomonas sp. S9]